MKLRNHLRWLVAASACAALAACGGGSGSQGSNSLDWNPTPDWNSSSSGSSGTSDNSSPAATGDNTVPISVDMSMGSINRPYVTVTLCVPGTQSAAQCATVKNVIVDTGSTGLRIAASAIPTLAPLLLTQAGATDDKDGASPIAECMPFASGFTWGSVKRADIRIGSKTAANMPIQVMSDGAFATPSDCTSRGGADLGTPAVIGGNGILGIDNFTSDSLDAITIALPGLYYYCPSSNGCVSTRMPAAKEVRNPVTGFATDNNGTVIRLPAVPAGGKTSVTGQLVFGVGTQQNNMLPASATVLAVDAYGTFTTQYKGRVLNWSAIDSGTPAFAFADDAIPSADSMYTPATPLALSASMESTDGSGSPVSLSFAIGNATGLLATNYAAYNNLGMYFSNSSNTMFLWGLPFFFGRNVYTVIGNAKVGSRTGPFVAF
ncbi:DUF3443 domain-containing protein [Paraburkholderia xenovorans]|uniref:DUF3443 domain-containing protein n=1 Tax=Paraburkholderia xenovorans TaxID=36873 RepID=UPI0038BDEE21